MRAPNERLADCSWQDKEYSVLRQSHIATIEEIGQYKIKIELKEKSRQQVPVEQGCVQWLV